MFRTTPGILMLLMLFVFAGQTLAVLPAACETHHESASMEVMIDHAMMDHADMNHSATDVMPANHEGKHSCCDTDNGCLVSGCSVTSFALGSLTLLNAEQSESGFAPLRLQQPIYISINLFRPPILA